MVPHKPPASYFRAGDPIPQSGVYRAFHADHRNHEVLLLKGELFPICDECKENVEFELLHPALIAPNDPGFIRVYVIPHPRQNRAAGGEGVA